MDRRFLSILAALAIIFIGVFLVTKNSGNSANPTKSTALPTNHITGEGKKGVTLTEYGDYECPVCELYYQPLKQVVAQMNQDIYFQFRNLPLSSIHANAFAAARAAEAAGLQNKYWEMHNKLYDSQNEWASTPVPQATFETYAQQLGLNVAQFKKDYASNKVNDAINADLAAFNKTGKDLATPTFFLDGVYLDNAKVSQATSSGSLPSADKFIQAINAEIAKKNSAKQ